MRYLDTSTAIPTQTVGHWLATEDPAAITELHVKAGYFSIGGVRPLINILRRVRHGLTFRAALGSNEASTGAEDIRSLLAVTGDLVNTNSMSVVAFDSGLFHSKVYAIRRADNSKAIYIGSANLTIPAMTGINIETGIILDTNDGDSATIYDQAVESIRLWSQGNIAGSHPCNNFANVNDLLRDGYLRPRSEAQPGLNRREARRNRAATARRRPIYTAPAFNEEPGRVILIDRGTAENLLPGNTLVAELAGPGRWQQAVFNKNLFPSYFQVPAGSNEPIALEFTDGVNNTESTPAARGKESSNYTLELTAQRGINFPDNGRPIAVFFRNAHRDFSYCLTMPGEHGYSALLTMLNAEWNNRNNDGLRRLVTDLDRVKTWWPDVPLPTAGNIA